MVLDLSKKNPFQRPPMAMVGDDNAEPLQIARSDALDAWEYAERSFAIIFSKLVSPRGSGFAAQRAYGQVIAAQVRRHMIDASAEVYFLNFPNDKAQTNLPKLLGRYLEASARRNEFAHGIIGGDHVNKNFWRFLVPNTWASKKRRVDLSIDFRYSSEQIVKMTDNFHWLGGQGVAMFDLLDHAYQSSSKNARKQY